jgi:hypothetical protein
VTANTKNIASKYMVQLLNLVFSIKLGADDRWNVTKIITSENFQMVVYNWHQMLRGHLLLLMVVAMRQAMVGAKVIVHHGHGLPCHKTEKECDSKLQYIFLDRININTKKNVRTNEHIISCCEP